MKKSTRYSAALALLLALGPLGGCSQASSDASASSQDAALSGQQTAASAMDTSALFSDRDLEGTYDESAAVAIQLSGNSAACDSSAVTVEGSTITITAEGVYLLSGTLTDGQIVVNAGETDKVQLVLKGADITSSTSAAIYALQADKVFLTLAQGTENTLTNGGEYIAIDDNNIDGVIFAKTDLTLNGTGSLTINAQAGHGVVSKDDLVITGGSYTVTAASHGLSAKDSIAIAGGTFAITSGKDGIHAENSEDTSLGYLYLADGTYTITAQGDAISASGAAQIDGGTYTLTTGEGSASVTMTSSDTAAQPGGHGGWSKGTLPDAQTTDAQAQTTASQTEPTQTEPTQTEMDTTDSTSQKGIKAEGGLVLNGGVFTMDTVDDCLHSGGDLLVTAGEFTLSSGDDAVHSDAALTIQNGTFTIPYCYEGLEGLSITIEDGTFTITSYDDGLNAAGGADSSGLSGFGAGPQDTFSTSSDSFILINGGTFTVVSSGDCLDSNGDMTINGGTLNLTCNGSGDTALDCDGTFTHNGGDLTTNDGSEENPGQMGGGGGRGGMSQDGQRPSRDAGDLQAPDSGTGDTAAAQ